MSVEKSFDAVVSPSGKGAATIALPFDPDTAWGMKPTHHVSGVVGACRVRGPLVRAGEAFALKLGPAWLRDSGITPGARVRVTLAPEGPQRAALDPDIAAALAAAPKAAAFFDGLAQFYRKAYLTWIAGTKQRPEERSRRIEEMVKLLSAGVKERPR